VRTRKIDEKKNKKEGKEKSVCKSVTENGNTQKKKKKTREDLVWKGGNALKWWGGIKGGRREVVRIMARFRK